MSKALKRKLITAFSSGIKKRSVVVDFDRFCEETGYSPAQKFGELLMHLEELANAAINEAKSTGKLSQDGAGVVSLYAKTLGAALPYSMARKATDQPDNKMEINLKVVDLRTIKQIEEKAIEVEPLPQ